MITTASTDPATQAAALFLSDLSRYIEPTATEVQHAIVESLLAHGGARGCAADLAARFGDYPELAVPRMRWARGVVDALDHLHHHSPALAVAA
jgi:hypothetical protein